MLKLPSTLPTSSPLSEEEFVSINIPIEKSSRGNVLTSHAHSVPNSSTPPSNRQRLVTPTQQSSAPVTPTQESSAPALTTSPVILRSITPSPLPPRSTSVDPNANNDPPSLIPPHPLLQQTESDSVPCSQLPVLKTPAATKYFRFDWLPKDQVAPKNISSAIDPSNIVEGS
ncbi:hypothetical protein PCASD_00272 [Puccinia coronata f. sp. avenae]|uniref:Uncharacterized protein n=1 Tax=Puccinia coronata f. sp. avenae TaxID=200324 RepID=A0A2N5VNB9_9BASI|nr:hypothetical protein PCASD_00272 [Puccinia coronata f. sp. avenae]